MRKKCKNNFLFLEEQEIQINPTENFADEKIGRSILILPLFIGIFFVFGFTQTGSFVKAKEESKQLYFQETSPKVNFSALFSNENFSEGLRDTVYTDRNLWLELRIDQQQLYVHYRNGQVKRLPVSTGNSGLSKGISARDGLFAIFHKEEVHLSSQFENARMNYFMPYNQGIGFHGLQGTGYYGNLGVRPSSHGCTRMRNEDVKILFRECDIGTIVLAHHGKSARVVTFAPEGFMNKTDYSKNDYMSLLAYNLGAIYDGKFLITAPKRFIVDGNQIPRNGFNVGNSGDIPEKQMIPVFLFNSNEKPDKLDKEKFLLEKQIKNLDSAQFTELFSFGKEISSELGVEVSEETIKKLSFNAGGILPYFPPNR